MQLQTKYFGEIEYQQEDILHFPKGLFGFETETQFLLLPFAGSAETLLCFQSVATPSLAFIAMNPFSLSGKYAPHPSQEELEFMEVSRSEDLCYYVLCAVKEPVSQSTVNLKCPVVVNPDICRGMQVILDTDEYHMRHSLAEFQTGEGDGAC